MSDKKLNEVTKVTDMAYVPVIMADGSIGQIAKADLASVVAGLMGFNSSFLGYVGAIGDYGTYKDVDNLPKNGYYDVKGTSNITGTVPFQSYGLLINISGIGTSGYGFQLLLANNSTSTGTRIAMRVRINNTWIGWTTLS